MASLVKFKSFMSEAKQKDTVDSQQFLMPSDLSVPVFLVAPPFSLDASTPNNKLMKNRSPEERKVNTLKAVNQFLAIYTFMSKMSLVYLLPAKDGLGDLPYVANLGINLPHKHDNTIIISNYKSPPRRGETPLGVTFFETLGYDTVVAPEYFEGEADLKYLHGNNYVGAYGERTNMNALNWFTKTYDMNIIPVEITNEKMYHLDCVVFPLESHKTFVVTSAIGAKALKALGKLTDVIDVDKKAGEEGLTNCVRVGNYIANGTIIHTLKKGTDEYDNEKHKNDTLEHLCARCGYDVAFFDISEFVKSGAALSCMVMHLNYPNLSTEQP